MARRFRTSLGQAILNRFATPKPAAAPPVSSAQGPAQTDPKTGGGGISTAVIFVQYSTQKYPGALQKLLVTLDRIVTTPSVFVIDNAQEGDWIRRISHNFYHAAGDNSGWEFSAFDKGLSLVSREGFDPDVIILVTDAFSAYGDEFLSLIPNNVTTHALELDAMIGWTDSWPQQTELFGLSDHEWLRTSFLVAPARRLKQLTPLCYPLDNQKIFSGNPEAPFLDDAPLGDGLKRYLIEWLTAPQGSEHLPERWHSNFGLTGDTLPLFESKVRAILREHLLSARLRRTDCRAIDFRLLDQLSKANVSLDRASTDVARWQWGRWRQLADELHKREFRCHFDRSDYPRTVQHGQPLDVLVEGWVLAPEAPDSIRLDVGTEKSLFCFVNGERDDVLERFPEYPGTNPGFSIRGTIQGLAPGTHSVVLCFDGLETTRTLEDVTVLPVVEFTPRRILVPDTWPRARPVPLSVSGELRSSFRATRAFVLLDGAIAPSGTYLSDGTQDETGLWLHKVSVNAAFEHRPDSPQNFVEISFDLEGGGRHVWKKGFRITDAVASCRVVALTLGPLDPETQLTPLSLEVNLMDTQAGDILALTREDLDLLRIPVPVNDQRGAARVATSRPLAVPAGRADLTLELRRGSKRMVLWTGTRLVEHERPAIHLEDIRVELAHARPSPRYRLTLRGWVENHFLVDCLIVEIDSSRAGVLGMHELRPDVSTALGEPLVSHQGFDAALELENITPGERVVHVIATQRGGESARVSRRVVFDDTPENQLTVTSADLERLARGELTQFYSAITLTGSIRTAHADMAVALLVDDRVGDEQAFPTAGEYAFRLRAAPDASGDYSVRFIASSRGRLVYSTEPRSVSLERIEFPEYAGAAVGALLDRFSLRDKIVGLTSDQDVATRLLEAQPERLPDYLRMLSAVARRLDSEGTPGSEPPLPPHEPGRRRLRVLFISWETPSRYHGGGVYLTKMLEGLGAEHDITLIHTFGIDEVGQVDAVRPYVKKIVSVPRTFQPAAYRGAGMFPQRLYDGYIPELRRIVELEATSHAYDLIDYEYSSLGPYVVGGLPSVMTIHEMGYTAVLNSAFRRATTLADALPSLDQLIKAFHYNTCGLPELTPHLITLTREDAEALGRFNSNATLYTSPTGVDIDYFGEAAGGLPDMSDIPALVYVGNYQHPPNVHAVRFFAKEVMPTLRRTYPTLEFHVIGPRAPSEVRELDGIDGVRVVGFVDDLRPWLAGATAYVAPLFTGTGMRIKIAEALASGLPLIATPLAIRGLPAEAGTHFLEARDAPSFITAVSRTLERPEDVATIAREGRRLIEQHGSWQAAVQKRADIWQAVVSAHEGSTTRFVESAPRQLVS